MPGRLSLTPVLPDAVGEVLAVADAARDADGTDPLNEQARFDLESGRRSPWLARIDGAPAAAAVAGGGELDLVVVPSARRQGVATAVLERLLPGLEPDVSAWSHGDHPAAAALASRFGFERVRTLLRLQLPRLDRFRQAAPANGETEHDGDENGGVENGGNENYGNENGGNENGGNKYGGTGIRITAFDPENDAADWLALNARAFASHPEQGRVSAADLAEREAEPWFDPGDFLVARTSDGLLGYHWMKLEPGSDEGEVYVLGVDPDASRRGLGRRLLTAGLHRMAERGRTRAALYVEGDNAPALALYRSVGFVDDAIDVQYRRSAVTARSL